MIIIRPCRWAAPAITLMKKLILFLSLLALPAMGQKTNVVLGWNDTNNFHPAITRPSDGTVIIPAVTEMVYKVYSSTNLATPVKSWAVLTNVLATTPGTNLITAVVPAKETAQFFTVTASDTKTGLESDFSNWLGLSPVPAPVKTGIFPYDGN
jgi:hypothetical protein